ncbi:MAG TPA: endonuclease, partial [Candidatus Moranbacteria bacterium]|nr:endonuclease [Candidatus Moranbacteria bacterium]
MHVGAHESIAGGIQNAPERAHDLGCEVMQIFTLPPQGGKIPELTPEIIKEFTMRVMRYAIRETYIHTPYYINLASASNRIRYGSSKAIREELERGNLIGAKYVMTHLGSAKELGQKESIEKVAHMLQKTLEGYSGETKLILENSAGAGEIIGDDLKELGEIISKTNSPAIAGICLDTQHSFASGYDWRDFEKTLQRIDEEIGLEKIKSIHCNDSQTDCRSNKDRHEHIGQGKIGLEAFQNIVNFAKKNNIDLICETESPENKNDIQTLKKMIAAQRYNLSSRTRPWR